MSSFESHRQFFVGLFLVCLMLATRGHHFASVSHLPDATWAIFFLAGAYLRPALAFYVLCAVAVAIDWVAITWGGVSAFCVTAAYFMLLPTYGSLWLGGRWYVRRQNKMPGAWMSLIVSVALSAVTAEAISSGSFYFFGGKLVNPTFAGFFKREAHFFPALLGMMALYIGLVVLIGGFLRIRSSRDVKERRQVTAGLS